MPKDRNTKKAEELIKEADLAIDIANYLETYGFKSLEEMIERTAAKTPATKEKQ
jgi:hypothetical protein